MIKERKANYVAPTIEVIKMESEGILAMSGESTTGNFGNGGVMGSSAATRTPGYNSASGSDLEDMINDILTIEQ